MPGLRLKPVEPYGLAIFETATYADDRGWFAESFNEREFSEALAAAGLPPAGRMVQDNHSRSAAGVVRGLHFQLPPHAQGKLVRVLSGAIFDAAVDIRANSPTFGQWFAIELSASNRQQLWIPPGFAHGFQVLGDVAEVFYKTTDYYAPAAERSIAWHDPSIGIPWPDRASAVLSGKDAQAPLLSEVRSDLLGISF